VTQDEMRRQKADLLLEYEEAEQHLAHLQEKAIRTGQRVEAVSKWLLNAGEPYKDRISDRIYVSGGGGSTTIEVLSDPQVAIAMDFEAATKLIEEIRTSHRKIQELKQRKANLGLK
jgi:hypothetical protein